MALGATRSQPGSVSSAGQAGGVAPFPIRRRTDADRVAVADLLLATHHSDAYPIVLPPDLVAWGAAENVLAAWVAVEPASAAGEPAAGESTGEERTAGAAAGGRVVGHAVLTEVDRGQATAQWVAATGRPEHELAVVRRLVVHRRAHRSGTGRALLATAVDAAHALGRRPVLDMADNLHAAHGLYLTAGFELVGAYDLDLAGHLLHVLTWIGPEPPP